MTCNDHSTEETDEQRFASGASTERIALNKEFDVNIYAFQIIFDVNIFDVGTPSQCFRCLAKIY